MKASDAITKLLSSRKEEIHSKSSDTGTVFWFVGYDSNFDCETRVRIAISNSSMHELKMNCAIKSFGKFRLKDEDLYIIENEFNINYMEYISIGNTQTANDYLKRTENDIAGIGFGGLQRLGNRDIQIEYILNYIDDDIEYNFLERIVNKFFNDIDQISYSIKKIVKEKGAALPRS